MGLITKPFSFATQYSGDAPLRLTSQFYTYPGGKPMKKKARRKKPTKAQVARKAAKLRRGRMKLSEVPEGVLFRVVGGEHWHDQLVTGSVMVLRERKENDVLVLHLLTLLVAGQLKTYPVDYEGLKAFTWVVSKPRQEAQEVETITSYAELISMFPGEKWPDSLNTELIVRPTYKLTLEGVVLTPEAKAALVSTLSTHRQAVSDTVFKLWGFGKTIEKGKGMALLFYGPPGTGKTKCAEAIAADFQLKMKLVDPAMLWSSEPGAAERTIKQVFDHAQKNAATTLLLFDECEVLIADRAQTGQILAAQTNALLSALERFDGISIFTTNRTPVLDPAFERRLQLKLEFPKPDKALREAIWRALVPQEAPLAGDVCFRTLAGSELSGGHIKNVLLNAARRAAVNEYEAIHMKHLLEALTDELNGMAAFAEEDTTPRLGGGRGSFGMNRSVQGGIEIKKVNSLLGENNV